jgi:hypothetical protein
MGVMARLVVLCTCRAVPFKKIFDTASIPDASSSVKAGRKSGFGVPILLAGCGGVSDSINPCSLVSDAEASRIVGAPLQGRPQTTQNPGSYKLAECDYQSTDTTIIADASLSLTFRDDATTALMNQKQGILDLPPSQHGNYEDASSQGPGDGAFYDQEGALNFAKDNAYIDVLCQPPQGDNYDPHQYSQQQKDQELQFAKLILSRLT